MNKFTKFFDDNFVGIVAGMGFMTFIAIVIAFLR